MALTDSVAVLPTDLMTTPQLRTRVAELEDSLRVIEERIAIDEQVFFDNPTPSIVYSVENLAIINANRSAIALYGYTVDELRKLSIKELFLGRIRVGNVDLDSELRKPLNVLGNVGHRAANGRDLMVSLLSFAFDNKGVNARMMMIEDRTARHATEEALRSSEERFRELVENANDIIFLHDLKGNILEINRAAEHLTGYARTEVLGKNFSELVAPEARHLVLDLIRTHLGGSAPQHSELPVVSKEGKLRYLEVSTRLTYRRGHPVAVQGIARDITERKHAQQRLLESARELQYKNEELSRALQLAREATRLKEQFLANTSHELRTPMNGIMGMINLLKGTELTADQRDYADVVSQCANDLLTIINDLLDISQIGAKKLMLATEPFDVHESVRSVVKLLRVRAAAKDLDLRYEVSPGVPQFIYGDCVRFRQILTNLIANAVKFTPSGSVQAELTTDRSGNQLICRVIDTGIGVEETVRDRIFEAFFQVDGTNRRQYGGTGLGLTICKQLVEAMGGRIGVAGNNSGLGTTFWFELPMRVAGAAEATVA